MRILILLLISSNAFADLYGSVAIGYRFKEKVAYSVKPYSAEVEIHYGHPVIATFEAGYKWDNYRLGLVHQSSILSGAPFQGGKEYAYDAINFTIMFGD